MKRAYIDSCIWVLEIEGLPAYQNIVDRELQCLTEDGWKFCTSDVVLFEVLSKPLKNGQKELVQRYKNLFKKMKKFKGYANVFKDALLIAQSENLKAMDTIHVAIAKHYHCQLFVSSDPHFRDLKAITPYWIDLSKNFVPATASKS
jgi:predicted nucleic acid-binding protein